MAAAKDTFEPNTFEAVSFACGTLRGTGVDVVTIEYFADKTGYFAAGAEQAGAFRPGAESAASYNPGAEATGSK